MTHPAVLLLSIAGFACLSLSMGRHQKEVVGRALPRSRSRLLRGLGFLLVAAALPVAILGKEANFGSVAWFGHLSLAAAVVFVVLLWRRQQIEAKP